jgi:hypothetical protein
MDFLKILSGYQLFREDLVLEIYYLIITTINILAVRELKHYENASMYLLEY